jgi:hypothetical protein
VVLAVPRGREAELLGEHGVADEVRVHVAQGVRAGRVVADGVEDRELHVWIIAPSTPLVRFEV